MSGPIPPFLQKALKQGNRMFGKSYRLFKLLGFEVRVDLSWLILALLVTWSLAEGLFPYYFKGLSTQTYWVMGMVGVVGLLFSIVFHEFSHSLVARRYGMPIHGISLFIFGGVAEMRDEPPSARSEFLMAVAGPISSVFLMGVFYAAYTLAAHLEWPGQIGAVSFYLAYLNGILAAFNLVPAFPLDGGRMLRALLWGWRRDIGWATRIAAAIGSGFGLMLIVIGVFAFINGYLIGGMWWVLIGLFLRGAADMSYKQLLIRQRISGRPVRQLMNSRPVVVPPDISVQELVEQFVYKYHHKMFPIVDKERLVGCISTKDIRSLPREEWARHQVREWSQGCSGINTVDSGMDAAKALSLMSESGNSRLMVVEKGRLAGLLTLKDLLRFLSLDMDRELRA